MSCKGVSGGQMSDEFNLYEFPQGYTGRKTYVGVRGHSRSVPVIYTYKGADGRNYILPEFGGDWSGYDNYSHAVQAPMFIRDIGEYKSPLDGSMITSRSQHREHMKRHDVIEVGNERRPTPRPDHTPAVSARETAQALKRHLEEVKAMPDATYAERVAKQQYAQREPIHGL